MKHNIQYIKGYIITNRETRRELLDKIIQYYNLSILTKTLS
jgi:hypothetical protein